MRAEVRALDTELSGIVAKLTEERKQIEAIERENLVSDEKAKSLTNNINRLTEETQRLAESIEKNTARKAELEEKIKVLNHTIYVSEASLNEKKAKVDASVETINKKKTEIIDLGKRLKDATQKTAAKKSEYEKSKLAFENNLKQLEKLSSSNSSQLESLSGIESEKNKLEDEFEAKSVQFEKAGKELKDTLERISKLSDEINSTQTSLNAKTFELQNVRTKAEYLSNLSDSLDDYSEGVRYLVKEFSGKNPVTVLETIEVEDKFKIAIETALGEISNYMIVGNLSDAEELISVLTEKEKGKVTFILNDLLTGELPGYLAFDDYVPEFVGTKGVYGFADEFVMW